MDGWMDGGLKEGMGWMNGWVTVAYQYSKSKQESYSAGGLSTSH